MFKLICLAIIVYVLWDMNKKCRRFRIYEVSQIIDGKIVHKYYPQHRMGPFWFDYNKPHFPPCRSEQFHDKANAEKYLRLRIEEWKHGKQKRKYYVE